MSLLDSAGVAQTNYTYEPFGNTTVSGSASSNPSQYTGRDNDGTGLYYYRARYYSPTLQRFISEDPIDFAGGDTNLYAYVGNSPCNFTDPSGQFLAGACLMGALMTQAADLLFARKVSVKSVLMGCAMGMLFALGGRALGAILRALAPRMPRPLYRGVASDHPFFEDAKKESRVLLEDTRVPLGTIEVIPANLRPGLQTEQSLYG